MAIYVKSFDDNPLVYVDGEEPAEEELYIIADSEAEIGALGENITVGGCCTVKATPGSIAIVAVEGLPTYMLNASKVWVKVA